MKKTLVVIGILLICSGPLIVLTGTAYTLMLPNLYASSVRISVQEDAPQVHPFDSEQGNLSSYNPYFLRTQFEIIQSKPVLYEVINRLNLQEEWGTHGDRLPRNVALRILQNSIEVFQQRDTSLIVISVKRTDPDEAADIANELAATYRDSRLDLEARNTGSMIDALNEALADQQQRVEKAEKRVKDLDGLASENPDGSGSHPEESKPFRKALADLEIERLIYNKLNEKIRERMILMEHPRNPVEIIDIAEPNHRPVSPNLFLNMMILLAVGGSVSVAGIVMLVLGLKKKYA